VPDYADTKKAYANKYKLLGTLIRMDADKIQLFISVHPYQCLKIYRQFFIDVVAQAPNPSGHGWAFFV